MVRESLNKRSMTIYRNQNILTKLFIGVFFIAFFMYFAIFNRYSLAYHEQIQLFRFDLDYLTSFFTKPGGPVSYLSTFFIQFFLYPVIAVFILTLSGLAAYALTGNILKKYGISGLMWSLLPVLLLGALHSDYTFSFVNTLGFLLTLSFISLYISIKKPHLRYAAGFVTCIFLYLATGGFSLLATLLFILHELFFVKNRYRLIAGLGYAFMMVTMPYFAWKFIY